MALDPNIPMSFQMPQLLTPMQAQSNALNLQNLMANTQLKQQEMQQNWLVLGQQMAVTKLANTPGMRDPATGMWTEQGMQALGNISPDLQEKASMARQAWNLKNADIAKVQATTEEAQQKAREEKETFWHETARDPALIAYNEVKKNGATEEAATAAGQAVYDEGYQEVASSGRLSTEEMKKINRTFDPARITARALKYKDYMEQQEKDKADKRAADKEAREENKAESALGKLEADYRAGRINKKDYEADKAKLDAPTKTMIEMSGATTKEGTLTSEGRDLVDELAMRDPSFMSRMGVKNIAERNRIVNDWAKAGHTADDIISGRIATKASVKEGQVLAGQKAGLERVEEAITMKGGIGDQVIDAAKKIDASKFRPFNKVSQLLQTETSDPELAAYKVKLIALRDEFATVINKGGAPTEGSRAQASEIMDQYAPNAVPSIVKAIKQITATNKKALDENLKNVGKSAPAASLDETSTTPPPLANRVVGKTKWQGHTWIEQGGKYGWSSD